MKQLEDSLKSKGANVYRTHNEYIAKLREYQFLDQLYVYKIRNLLTYHQSIECLLNQTWFVLFFILFIRSAFVFPRQNLLESIANYPNSQRSELLQTMEFLHRTITGADPRHCYDELCKVHSKFVTMKIVRSQRIHGFLLLLSFSIPSITTTPQLFNDLIRQSSGLTKLKADKFIVVESTKQEIEQRMEKLNNSIKEPIPKMTDLINDRQMFVK